jgi:acyl-CoA synthetase (AMP-forming)/AMP-acid ligase II
MPGARSEDRKRSIPFSSLPSLLQSHAKRIPDRPAILAPGHAPLTYGRFYQHIETTGVALRAMGIGRRDRVAVVLPNGPEMTSAILAVAANAACAPMNPAYGPEELDRYFDDLRPCALITRAGTDSPARRVALSRGVCVVDISSAPDAEAGLFTLTGDVGRAGSREAVSSDDVALLLLTSGTTARPKIVPLTHANVCASAYSSVAALALRETDRCLNVLPLFHGHGLIATVMTSLAAGASIVSTPGCDIERFFGWITTFRPTWYSAVPTMHQAILAQARQHPEQAADSRLRLIRSASAPLPPRVFAELERTFETTVIEFYGMTETASSPIACNPLPPGQRKAGSVGLPVGLDVAIMDEGGSLLSGGHTGQVVVRGASVMRSYDGDPSATAAAFAGDWFKTGDRGFFDDEGYLFLAGRTREMINRGGEKVTPREVDEALLEHPAVAEAVTFAMAHATLGEDVAAAIVLRPGATVTPQDIRQFASSRVADFKVPRQVFVLKEIPKSSTGKVQRIGLAARLGLDGPVASARTSILPPRTALEKALAKFWAQILQVEQIGIHDDFFALGGDSLLAARVLTHMYQITHREVEVARFFAAPTVAEMARHLETLIRAGQAPHPSSAVVSVSRKDRPPASIAQERLWNLQQALPGMPFFNVLYALRLTSGVDGAVLERSLNEVVRRHESLRTTFDVVDGRHVQLIAPCLTVPLSFHDLRALSKPKKEAAAHRLIEAELVHSFDLVHGPLFRASLVGLAEQEHLLLIGMHQVVCDGWSLGVLVEELTALYGAFSARKPSPLTPLSIQYADFTHWQRDWQSHPDMAAQLAYWRGQLRDPLPVIKLASVRAGRTTDNFRTARREIALPASLMEAAKRFSHREGGTLFMALVAALNVLLQRYSGVDDVRVATNVANRNRPGSERLIGPLVNTVVLRTDLGGDPTPREVMRRVRATSLAAFAHQDLPFEELVETLEHERALEPSALAPVMILLQNAGLRPPTSSGHSLAFEEANPSMPMPLVTITTFDVIVTLSESSQGLVGTCVYKPFFGAKMIDHMLRDFQKVLEHMVAQPERPISSIPVLPKQSEFRRGGNVSLKKKLSTP